MRTLKRLAYALGVTLQIVILGQLLLLALAFSMTGGQVFRYARF